MYANSDNVSIISSINPMHVLVLSADVDPTIHCSPLAHVLGVNNLSPLNFATITGTSCNVRLHIASRKRHNQDSVQQLLYNIKERIVHSIYPHSFYVCSYNNMLCKLV